MSDYRIGQKLNVIVESIDENGKAKFRVLKEDWDDSYDVWERNAIIGRRKQKQNTRNN